MAAASSKEFSEVMLRNDMPPGMRDAVVVMTREALVGESLEKDQATQIKKALEKAFDGIWHCIVGKSYGCSITNQTNYLCFFKITGKDTQPTYVLVFQSLDEEAHAMASAHSGGKEREMEDEGEEKE
jgi:dynein light chain LC8-type